MDKNQRSEILRALPSVDGLLRGETARKILPEIGAKRLTILARTATESLRQEVQAATNGAFNLTREDFLRLAETKLETLAREEKKGGLQKVINATGVIVHTNLGRAPLSEKARQALIETAAGYCTLEYDIESGKRGKRGARVEKLLAELTGAESALVVNNCAAAAFLVLTVLARAGEAVVSRGELVEIGGDFRVPDVMEQSGAIMKEVGTTNRTKISDYERAINENTRLVLKVHPSNYRIVGFTAAPDLKELIALAHQNKILFYEDAGSGALFDLNRYGLTDEPIISHSIKAGADVVTFSGDKLLGGAQSGLIVGRHKVIEKIRTHPLYRALRVDKLIYAALEATLDAFRRETAFEEIPVLRMLAVSEEEATERIENFIAKIKNAGENQKLQIEIIDGNSVIGGGSAPTAQPATRLIAVTHNRMNAVRLEEKFRLSATPIITRILENRVLIDLRTVSESEEIIILSLLNDLIENS